MSSRTDKQQYHERLALVRNCAELSQHKIAQRIGVSLRAYQNYERGEREMPIDVLASLYRELRIDPLWMLTGEGSMTADPDTRYRLEQRVLDRVFSTVERLERRLSVPMSTAHKARFVGLLYEQSQLLSQVTDDGVETGKLQALMLQTVKRVR